MTLPRKSLVSLSDTPYYHCVSRCVRRAYLCGLDHYSGQSYEHRRSWLENKLLDTASVFAIRLCSYAVMSNHYHVVLHVRTDVAEAWSDKEVVSRWHQLFNGTLFSQRFAAGDALMKVEQDVLKKDIALWRERLTDISWFMRIINEFIARKANAEDQCTGSFWESRFKSHKDIALRGTDQEEAGVGDPEVLAILGRMVKQRQESARAYEEGGRLELAEKELLEIKIIEEFLPKQLSDDETAKAVDAAIAEVGADSIRDMGKVMGVLKGKYTGQMDFGKTGPLVKDRLG